jgi:hypothetical protein
MKKMVYFFDNLTFIRALAISFLLTVCALFFLGGDFYFVLSVNSFNYEKKYQDEEKSEKSEKNQEDFFSFINDSFKTANNLIIDCSNSYFTLSEKKRLMGYFDILSPPPDQVCFV